MVSVQRKLIKGRGYLYASYSFRLPDGTVKKASKLIATKAGAAAPEVHGYFLRKEREAYQDYAGKVYRADSVLTWEKIKKIEEYRAEYKQLLRNLTQGQMKDILDRFTANFTYESNAIEGSSLTLKDVTLILAENIVPRGKDLREVYETRNTRIANQLLFENKIKITRDGIIRLHNVLMEGTGVARGFKRLPNFLMMRNVKTTPPEQVDQEMNALIAWYRQHEGNEHPIRLAAEFHSRFEKIHPFEDGNGRVGRVLINAVLLQHGYPPVIIRKTMRQSYFDALAAFDRGYQHKFIRFLMEKMESTFTRFFKVYVKYL